MTVTVRLLACAAALLGGCADVATGNGDGPPDGSSPVISRGGDSLPPGAISFFKTPLCPVGWYPYGPAAGRLLVPAADAPGTSYGAALASGEDRRHGHGLKSSLGLKSISFAGISGEANHGVAGDGAAAFTTTTDLASTGLPYFQLLICQKSALPRPASRPIPTGTLVFFAQASCPDGWIQAGVTQGRHLVALPSGGKPDQTFGGPPLGAPDKRAHTHPTSDSTSLPAHGIALASGCCASGYGQSGSYSYTATTDAGESALPYLQLLQCQKL